jgi:hypothetical protein
VNNWVGGDQFNQSGNYNIGKIDQRPGSTGNSLTGTESAQAISELAAFIDHLQRIGLIPAAGEPVDAKAIEAEVSKQESKLRKVTHALARGASRTLSTALDHVVAPLVLKMIEKHFG